MEPSANLTKIFFAVGAHAKAVNPDKAPSQRRIAEYPLQIWYLLLSLLALVSICHFTARLLARKSVSAGTRGPSRLTRLPLAVAHVFRTMAFRTTASFAGYTLNLAEFFLGCGYIAVIFTWALINTTDLEGHRFSPRYFADRSGLIVATQFPLLIALGMKNNIISLLTGISYDKLSILHRVVARVLCVLIWVHAYGRLTQVGKAEATGDLNDAWFRWGVAAATGLTLLSFLSVKPLRKRSYEAFLVAHFFVGLILLIGAYMHAKRDTVTHYVWPSFVIWGFDRLLRYLRVFIVNGGYLHLFGRKDTTASLQANVDVVSARFLRVVVRVPSRVSWAPGQVAFLAIPSVSRTPWEAHPFTIANIDSGRPGAAEGILDGASRDEKNESPTESAPTVAVLPYSKNKELIVLIRVRGGFTKRLLDAAANKTDSFKAFIDGPYCTPPSITGFATVLLFAGGSGVSFTLPLLCDLIRESKSKTNPACNKIVFVWAIRDPEQIRVISDALSNSVGTDPLASLGIDIDIRIHVTTSVEDTDGDAASSETASDAGKEGGYSNKLEALSCARVLAGRPDVDEIVRAEVQAATGAVSVNVCGTPGLAAHVRKAVRAASSGVDILRGGASVSLHVESFGEA
ncbi:ferric reductase NAD binding domain-containing protein [Mycena metata]|uniref:Ferric reductase NAD binding domain-containing protein n=1 Tax=Mycena metata TaxID=1033252 RepID=A0AAD7JQE7_9AGAR|nr:ferric reductase NAD binding domain-containing protein [Mycena metata]